MGSYKVSVFLSLEVDGDTDTSRTACKRLVRRGAREVIDGRPQTPVLKKVSLNLLDEHWKDEKCFLLCLMEYTVILNIFLSYTDSFLVSLFYESAEFCRNK